MADRVKTISNTFDMLRLVAEKALRNGNEYKSTPVEFQLPLLGITEKHLSELNGKNVLDVGCGTGEMVEYLRCSGVLAEGIDPVAPESQNLIKRHVAKMGMAGGIPKPDKTYDLTVSFQNSSINSAFLLQEEPYRTIVWGKNYDSKTFNQLYLESQILIHEMIRTTKPGGNIRIFPGVPNLATSIGLSLFGYKISISDELIDPKLNARWTEWELQGYGMRAEVPKIEVSRTVITLLE